MKKFINHPKNISSLDFKISVDEIKETVFFDSENEDYNVLLETSPIYGDWNLSIFYKDESIEDESTVLFVENYIMGKVQFELNNTSEPFTYEDQLHATNLIYS